MFKEMKIGTMLFCLLGFLSTLLVVVGILGLHGQRVASASLETIYQDRLVPVTLLSTIRDNRRESLEQILLATFHDPRLSSSKLHEADHPITQHTDTLEAIWADTDRLIVDYAATFMTPEEEILFENFRQLRKKYRNEGGNQAIALLKERKFDEVNLHITNQLIPLFNASQQNMEALIQLQMDVAKDEKDRVDADFVVMKNTILAGIIIGIALALVLGYWMIRSITGRVTGSVSAMSTSTTEIAATIAQHERTAKQQSTAATESSATITELSASSRQSSDQAANVATTAEKASAAAAQGGETTRQAVAAMNDLKQQIGAMADQILRLGEQTAQIGGIAALVRDLSGQINMLALNAAVEAARAGEHGKGFAVVAAEVRKLADQSRKSAEQATSLVGDIQRAAHSSIMMTEEGGRNVAAAAQLAQRVAELFAELSNLAGSVNESARQVMLNAKQQSAAFTQIVEATDSIATGAKEIAAGISQTKVDVQHLNAAAENLGAIV